ncbi:hypothetical protein N8E89_19285 (plasmid) [Phyllobacterium sp. A18/5-2]|uniref:rhamnan synthesis F family protein n=1 Tax=Phyllobacterium sp. A18/5-2 TaxID=2978392 RepID=UPI0021C5DEC8|nr:rhamnan synthesis F family protein [Phyllobacterium sp. A18/5-2]UXN66753.1 hypothetical protein N8E89_19285 [Phyllobacterium sp. A18/5-2]
MTKRLAIAFFYDAAGIVDEYYIHLIEALKPYVDHTILVSNGPLSKNSENNIRPVVEDLIVRKNVGFDVWAYKSALEQFGWDRLKEYDEVIFYNHTFYGPIFPFSEMFSAMDKRNCDFWGISAHRAISPNPFGDELGELPFHLNSHFIVVRREMHQSPAFKRYWTDMGRIESYIDLDSSARDAFH